MAQAHRRDWARVLAATARLTRDLDLAEECTQDAYAQALQTWPRTGIPDRPGAWLTTVARNRALDVLRRESVLRRALPLLVADRRRCPARRTPSTTTGCGWSSPAATRRCPGTPRSR